MLDGLRADGLAPAVILADGGYGEISEFRLGLEQRELDYVVQVKATTSAYDEDVRPETPAYSRPRHPADDLLARRLTRHALLALSRTARAAGQRPAPPRRRRGRAAASLAGLRMARRSRRADQVLALQPARRHTAQAARLARQAALADRAGLPRAQRRTRARSLRRPLLPRLAPPRHARLARTRLPHPGTAQPKSACAGLTLFQVLRELQQLVACWTGACPTCKRKLPRRTTYLHALPIPT